MPFGDAWEPETTRNRFRCIGTEPTIHDLDNDLKIGTVGYGQSRFTRLRRLHQIHRLLGRKVSWTGSFHSNDLAMDENMGQRSGESMAIDSGFREVWGNGGCQPIAQYCCETAQSVFVIVAGPSGKAAKHFFRREMVPYAGGTPRTVRGRRRCAENTFFAGKKCFMRFWPRGKQINPPPAVLRQLLRTLTFRGNSHGSKPARIETAAASCSAINRNASRENHR